MEKLKEKLLNEIKLAINIEVDGIKDCLEEETGYGDKECADVERMLNYCIGVVTEFDEDGCPYEVLDEESELNIACYRLGFIDGLKDAIEFVELIFRR